jgi:16S rRNA (cytidine1402-2'-O)-methyltransferase
MGNRDGVLAREMTKRHEEFIRGSLAEILKILEARPAIKGECTLLVTGLDENRRVEWQTVKSEIQDQLKSATGSVSSLAKRISQKYALPKNRVYKEALKIRDQK